MSPAIGDNVEYHSFAGDTWEATIVGISPEGRVDLDVTIPRGKGEDAKMRLTAIRWYEGPTEAPGARPRTGAMGV